jgi:hypothetical protein
LGVASLDVTYLQAEPSQPEQVSGLNIGFRQSCFNLAAFIELRHEILKYNPRLLLCLLPLELKTLGQWSPGKLAGHGQGSEHRCNLSLGATHLWGLLHFGQVCASSCGD